MGRGLLGRSKFYKDVDNLNYMKKRVFLFIAGILLIVVSVIFAFNITEPLSDPDLNLPKTASFPELVIAILASPFFWIGLVLIIIWIVLKVRDKKVAQVM